MAPDRAGVREVFRVVFEPRRLLVWIYGGRIVVASASFMWALTIALFANPTYTLIAAGAFVTAWALTAFSFLHTEINRRRPGPGFLYMQFVHDLWLITSVVHLTGGADSQFAALYILVNAAAALLLPIGSSLLLAMLGSVLYVGDAFLVSGGEVTVPLLFQLVVFTLVAVGTGYIAARLQEAGEGRAELQAELVSTRLRAADILGTIRAGIVTVDENGRLLYANPTASSLLGTALETVIGAPVFDQLRTTAPAIVDAVRRHLDEGRPITRAEGLLTRDGTKLPLGITTTSVSADLREVGNATTVIFQDISDEKRLEVLRRRAQRLEAVAELSASLAHEIKNPLASIRSAVEQISRRSAATDDERTLGALIVRESDRLSRLLTEFLDFARVQATRRERLDLRDVVRSATTLAGTHPDRKEGVSIDVALPDGGAYLDGDEDLLHRAVFNLVLNALQAAPARSKVSVTLRSLPRHELPSGLPFTTAAHSLEVRDEGGGIAPEIQDRLFEPFATTKVGGSGLGLAIVHRAIEAHRGLVLVDSDKQGTRFTVLLPIGDESPGVVS